MLETPKAVITKTEDENLNGNSYESKKEITDDIWNNIPKYCNNGQSAAKTTHYIVKYNNSKVHRLSERSTHCYKCGSARNLVKLIVF